MVILTSFPPPTEGIRHCETATSAVMQGRELGKGTLYIAEERLSWVGENGQGFSLEYPAVSLHAVSRDANAFPRECLYLMIDGALNEEETSDTEDGEDEPKTSEIRFVPDNKANLDSMYRAMTACQALHPDPCDSFSDDEEGWYDDAEDEGEEYDVSAAERLRGCEDPILLSEQPEADQENGTADEPMELGQFDDAEPDH